MKLAHTALLEDFGTRSLVIHGIMVLAFVNAVLAGLFVGGQLGLISFVALLNFTAGLWVAHSVHSLGNVATDDEYNGVLNELLGSRISVSAGSGTATDTSPDTDTSPSTDTDVDAEFGDKFDTGRFGRLLALISAVTAISLLTSAQVLSGPVFSIAVVAVGAIAVVTAMVGFMIALGSSYDAGQESLLGIDRNPDVVDVDGQGVSER